MLHGSGGQWTLRRTRRVIHYVTAQINVRTINSALQLPVRQSLTQRTTLPMRILDHVFLFTFWIVRENGVL